MYDLYNRDIAV